MILVQNPKDRDRDDTSDSNQDPIVLWLHCNYTLRRITFGILFPTLEAGMGWGELGRRFEEARYEARLAGLGEGYPTPRSTQGGRLGSPRPSAGAAMSHFSGGVYCMSTPMRPTQSAVNFPGRRHTRRWGGLPSGNAELVICLRRR